MAIQIRPVSPAVQKAIYFYLAEIKKIDPDMIIETEDWCMNFKNKHDVNLFYFTFSDPLSFRIKDHSDDSTYEYMAEDGTKTRRTILDKLRALIFESYMNRNGLVAKMDANLRTFILKVNEENEISRYNDEDDAFYAFVKNTEVYRITYNKKEKKFFLATPQHVFRYNENIIQVHEFIPDNFKDMKEHIFYSSVYYRNYNPSDIYPVLEKVRDYIRFTYPDQYREANNGHVISFNGENRDVLEFRVKHSGSLNISYFVNDVLRDKAFNKTNLLKLYELMEDEFYGLGHKIQEAFYEDQTRLLQEITDALLDYDKHVGIEDVERGIDFKIPYGDHHVFASIRRNKELIDEIHINDKTFAFRYENKEAILDEMYDIIVPIDPRVITIAEAIEPIYNDEDPHDGKLKEAQDLLNEFDNLHILLKSRNPHVRARIEETIAVITKFLDEKAKADAALALQNESYSRLLKKLNDLYLVIDELKIRVKVLEEKVDELELQQKRK